MNFREHLAQQLANNPELRREWRRQTFSRWAMAWVIRGQHWPRHN